MSAVMSPWIVRNYLLTGRFVPTTSVQGVAAHAGQFICKRLTFGNDFAQLNTEAAAERTKLAADLGYPSTGVARITYIFLILAMSLPLAATCSRQC